MKKKIFSLLLVFVMLVSMFPVSVFAADDCPYTYDGKHSYPSYAPYGDNGNGTHSQKCYYCGVASTTSAPHTYGNWSNDTWNGNHYRECTKCDAKETADHTMGYKKSVMYGSGYHDYGCTVCGSVESYGEKCASTTWKTSNTQHYQVCDKCGLEFNKSNHSLKPIANNDGTHSQKCECGYTKGTESCNYQYNSSYSDRNASGHTLYCSTCKSETAIQKHTMGFVKTTTGYHKEACTVCGYSTSYNSVACSSSTWKTTDSQHYKVCDDCGQEFSKASHIGKSVDNKDGTHTIGCSVCGKGTTEKHTMGAWQNNGSQHTRSCTKNCGYTESKNHTPKYTGTDGSTTHTVKCADCNYSTTESCTYSGNYVQGDSQHWKVCDKCNTKGTMTNHSGNVSSNNNGTHKVSCSTCGKNANVACTLSAWKNNSFEDNHYRECTVYGCDYEETQNHKDFVIEKYNSNQHKKVCGVCGDYELVNCTKKYTDNKDGKTHNITCDVCKNTQTNVAHTYDYNTKTCVCGAEKHDHSWKVTGSGNKITLSCTETIGVCTGTMGELTISASDSVYTGEANAAAVTVTEGSYLKELYAYNYAYIKYYEKVDGSYGYSSTSAPSDAGEYKAEITLTVNGSTATASVEFKITKADLENDVSATGYTGVYDGQNHGITVNAPSTATVQYSTDGANWSQFNANSYKDVGTYTVHYKVSPSYYDKDNYRDGEVTGTETVKITPFDLATVVTAESTEFTYNRYDHTTEGTYAPHSIKLEVGELPNYENATVEYSIDGGNTWSTQNPAFTDAGEYTVKYRVFVAKSYYGSEHSDNYIDAEGSKTVTIEQADLPIDGLVGYRGPYDGSTHYGFAYKYSTSYGDYFTLYWSNYLHKELNYSFSWKDENGEAKTLTVNAGDETPNGRELPGFTKQNVAKVDYDKYDVPGAHKVDVTISGKNYKTETFTYYVQIGPGGAVAADTTVPYDGQTHYIKNYIAGFLYGFGLEYYNPGSIKIMYKEHGSDTWLPYSQEPGQREVGSKDVDWMVTMDSDQNKEFGEEKNSFGSKEIFIGTNTVTVTAVPLTVTANNNTITYGDAPAANGYTVSGFVAGEDESVLEGTISYAFKSTAPYNVGTYEGEIIPKSLSAKNYDITFVAGDLTVEKKSVEVVADKTELEYNAAATSNVPTFSVKEGELVNGDTCSVTATYEDANGNPVEAPKEPGTYKAKFTLGNSNYTTNSEITFTIASENPVVTLTVTAKDSTITYGEEPKANGYTVSGLAEGDDASVLQGSVEYAFKSMLSRSVAPYKAGVYEDEIIPSGLKADNYEIEYVAGDLIVEKKEIGLDWGTLSFVYDGTHKQPTVKATGLVKGDTCELTVELYVKGTTTPVTETKEIGEYTIKVVGLSNDNYKLPAEVAKDYTIVAEEKDDTAPVIGKVEDGGTYYDDTDFTVTDDNLDKVTVDGKEVKPDANGDYTIPADNKEHTIVAVDEAGNTTTAKITVYKTYTVKYVASGKLVSEQKVGHGKDAVPPTVPEVEGYYGKWNKDGKNITADTTITAIYYDNNGVVRTGDETNAMLWAGLMFSGMAGLYGVAMYLKRKEEEE